MQVIFSKIELKISPFLTVIQFYSKIVEKLVDKSPQDISTRPTFRNTGCPKKNGTRINQLCMHLKRNPHKLMLYAL